MALSSIRGGLPFDPASANIDLRFICPYCHKLLLEPKFFSCGDRYCASCAEEILTSQHQSICVVQGCNESITADRLYSDPALKKELQRLDGILCSNTKNGCSWQGNYQSYQDHLQVCSFQCLQCEYCSTSFDNRHLFEEHHRICPKAPVSCCLNQFGCETKILREALQDHLASATVEHMQLLVNFLSSSKRQSEIVNAMPVSSSTIPNDLILSLRNDLQKQNQTIEQMRTDQKILQSTLQKYQRDLAQTRVTLKLNEGELCGMRKELDHVRSLIQNDGTFTWRLDNIRHLFHEAKNGKRPFVASSPFYTSKSGYKLALKIFLNGDKKARDTHLSLHVTIICGENDSDLDWPFTYPITLCLYDRSTKQDHVMHTLIPDSKSESFQQPKMQAGNLSSGIPDFCPLWKVFSNQFDYVKDNIMVIKAFIDVDNCPPSLWPHWARLKSSGLPTCVELLRLRDLASAQQL